MTQNKVVLCCEDIIDKLNLSWGSCCINCHSYDFFEHFIEKQLKTGEISYTCCNLAIKLKKAKLIE